MLVKQPDGRVKTIVLVPAVTPVTRPVALPTVATPGLVLVHVPPPVASVSCVVAPVQTVGVPIIGTGCVYTVKE